jgi:hypothetical protein
MSTATIIDWIVAEFADFMKKGYVTSVEMMNRAKKAFEDYYGSVIVEETMTSATAAQELDVSNVLSAVISNLDDAGKSASVYKVEDRLETEAERFEMTSGLDDAVVNDSVHQLGDEPETDAARSEMTSELDDADFVAKTWSFSEFCGVENKELAIPLAAPTVGRTQVIDFSLRKKAPLPADDDFFVTELSFNDFCEPLAPGRCCVQ